MKDSDLEEFFSNEAEVQRKQALLDDARDEEFQKSTPISHTGRYLCEVNTYAYFDKETHEIRTSPEMYKSEKGNLTLLLSLKVVDGTAQVAKGSSILLNIILSPAARNDEELYTKIMNFTKPKILALTGVDHMPYDLKWFKEWLTVDYKDENKKLVLVRDHKMKCKVMVTVDEDVYMEKIVMRVKSVQKALPIDKSETFLTDKVVSSTPSPMATSSVPTASVDYARAVTDDDVGVDKSEEPVVPEQEDMQ